MKLTPECSPGAENRPVVGNCDLGIPFCEPSNRACSKSMYAVRNGRISRFYQREAAML